MRLSIIKLLSTRSLRQQELLALNTVRRFPRFGEANSIALGESYSNTGRHTTEIQSSTDLSSALVKRLAADMFLRKVISMSNDLRPFECDQASLHHQFQMREERLNFLLSIDDLDDDRQVRRKPENLPTMHTTGPPKTKKSAKDCRACQTLLTRFEDDCFMKRQTLLMIIRADKNP